MNTSALGGGSNHGKDFSFHYAETLVQRVEMGKGVFIDNRNYGILTKGGDTVLPFDYLILKDYAEGKMFAIQDIKDKGEINRVYTIIDDTGNKLIEFLESRF